MFTLHRRSHARTASRASDSTPSFGGIPLDVVDTEIVGRSCALIDDRDCVRRVCEVRAVEQQDLPGRRAVIPATVAVKSQGWAALEFRTRREISECYLLCC